MSEKLLKRAVAGLLYHSGYYTFLRKSKDIDEPRLLILMYHDFVSQAVGDTDPFQRGKPTEAEFEAQLRILKRHFRVRALEDIIHEFNDEGRLSEPTAAITIDDGFSSSYDIAFPVLKKLGLTATIYMPTDWIDGKRSMWWIELRELICGCDISEIDISAIDSLLGTAVSALVDTAMDDVSKKKTLLRTIEPNLRDRPDTDARNLLSELRDLLPLIGEAAQSGASPITWEQAQEMSKEGIRFGAHTCSHANLKHLDLDDAEREIAESKRILEERLGEPVTGFAYPYGLDFAEYKRVTPILEKHGLDYAVTACFGNNDSRSDLYRLRRVTLPPTKSAGIVGRELILDYIAGEKR